MLTQLSINNYALINKLSIDFSSGLSIITGETGAGKSILLGALGLVLGNRADLSSLKDTSHKCIVEAKVAISNYSLEGFFNEVDLDYEPEFKNVTKLASKILPKNVLNSQILNNTDMVVYSEIEVIEKGLSSKFQFSQNIEEYKFLCVNLLFKFFPAPE